MAYNPFFDKQKAIQHTVQIFIFFQLCDAFPVVIITAKFT